MLIQGGGTTGRFRCGAVTTATAGDGVRGSGKPGSGHLLAPAATGDRTGDIGTTARAIVSAAIATQGTRRRSMRTPGLTLIDSNWNRKEEWLLR